MFAPPPLPLPHHRSAAANQADSLYALSASEALTSLLASLPSLPLVSSDAPPLAARRASVESMAACKVEEISDDDMGEAAALTRQHSKAGGRQESSSSLRSRPQSSGAYSLASQSTASSSHSFISALSPTPPNLPARSGPLTLQLATTLQPLPSPPSHAGAPLPPAPAQPAAPTTLTAILDPHLLHLLYLYSSRSLSPFNDHSIWSCFLSHLQQPDPNQPTHRLPLCDKQYQRSSRRSFKNHVWKCLCRHFPAIGQFTYSEFRRVCATDRTVMAGFHAVTLFPRPQKKRRSTAELNDGERWLCPHGCGQEYRNTSSTSIGRHLRKECRLKDMSEEEKQEERRTLKQHEKDVAAYQALRAVSNVAEVHTQPSGAMRLEPVDTPDVQQIAQNKRVRLSSTQPIATTISAPLLRLSSMPPTTASVSAPATTAVTLLPPVPTFSPSSTILPMDVHQLPMIAAILPKANVETAVSDPLQYQQQQQQQQRSVSVGDGVSGRGERVMSTAEIAMLEAQLMDTMHTQLVIDRLLADMTARAAVAAASNNIGSGGGPIPPTNTAGDAIMPDGMSDWRRGSGSAVNVSEMSVPMSQSAVTPTAPFSPPHFVSMSNAPSPVPSHPRHLQRPTDASTSRRLAAIQAAATNMGSPLPNQSPLLANRSIPLVRPQSSSSPAFSAVPSPPVLSSAPPPYPQLTSDEAVAVIRQQLSLRCVSFLSQPGRDIRQLPTALLQVVAGLPVALASTLVHDTLRALAFSPSQLGASSTLQRHGEHGVGSGDGSGNTTGAGSNSSTPVQSPLVHDYQASPSAHSASSGSSASYKAYSASSFSSTSMPLFPSAASILLSPLSLFDPHRLLTTPPLVETAPAPSSFQSSFSSPVQCAPSLSLALSPSLSALLPPPSMSSSPAPQLRSMSANLAQLHDWLNALPSSTASLYRQRLLPAAAHQMAMHDVGSPREETDMLRPHPQSHSHSHAAALAHATLAAAGQQKLLQLATPRGSKSSRACQTGNL